MKKILLVMMLSVAFYACNGGGNNSNNNNNNSVVLTDDQIFRQAIAGSWVSCVQNNDLGGYVKTEMVSEYGATASSGVDKFGIYSDSDCSIPLVEVEIYLNNMTTGAIAGETDQGWYVVSSAGYGNAPKVNFISGSSYIKIYDQGWLDTFQALGDETDYTDLGVCPSDGCDWYNCTGKEWVGSGKFPVLGENFYGYAIVNPSDGELYFALSGDGLFSTDPSDPNNRGDGSFHSGWTKE